MSSKDLWHKLLGEKTELKPFQGQAEGDGTSTSSKNILSKTVGCSLFRATSRRTLPGVVSTMCS